METWLKCTDRSSVFPVISLCSQLFPCVFVCLLFFFLLKNFTVPWQPRSCKTEVIGFQSAIHCYVIAIKTEIQTCTTPSFSCKNSLSISIHLPKPHQCVRRNMQRSLGLYHSQKTALSSSYCVCYLSLGPNVQSNGFLVGQIHLWFVWLHRERETSNDEITRFTPCHSLVCNQMGIAFI